MRCLECKIPMGVLMSITSGLFPPIINNTIKRHRDCPELWWVLVIIDKEKFVSAARQLSSCTPMTEAFSTPLQACRSGRTCGVSNRLAQVYHDKLQTFVFPVTFNLQSPAVLLLLPMNTYLWGLVFFCAHICYWFMCPFLTPYLNSRCSFTSTKSCTLCSWSSCSLGTRVFISIKTLISCRSMVSSLSQWDLSLMSVQICPNGTSVSQKWCITTAKPIVFFLWQLDQ